MWLLTTADLRHRALRFVVVTVLTAVVFVLLFLMTGLIEQFNQEPFLAIDGANQHEAIVDPHGRLEAATRPLEATCPLSSWGGGSDTFVWITRWNTLGSSGLRSM